MAAFAPRPSTAPRESAAQGSARARAAMGMGDLINSQPSVQQTGAMFESEFNPPPQPVTYFGLTPTQWLMVGAAGFVIWYFRKPIWNWLGNKLGVD